MATALLTRSPASSSLGVLTRSGTSLSPATRRRFLGWAAGGFVLLGLGACGDDDQADGAASTPTTPTRVVALGQGSDADALIALGIAPVGMSAAYNESGIYPWTAEALGSRNVEILMATDSLPVEKVAALKPDLIVATTHYDYEKDRSRLEQITTVLGPTTTADKETWQQTTMRVGEAVGRANEARRLVENTEATLASVRAEHPDWAGRTFTTGPVNPGEQLYTVSSPDDVSAALLQQLGLVLSSKVTALPAADTAGRANVSLEQLSVLDADVMLLTHFGGDNARTAFEANPLFQQLAAVRRGSYVVVDNDVAIGLAFPSVLSIPYSVERITPQLEKALDAR